MQILNVLEILAEILRVKFPREMKQLVTEYKKKLSKLTQVKFFLKQMESIQGH